MRRSAWGVLLALCGGLALAGCTGAELAVLGAASSGVKTGMEVTRSGRIKVAVMADGPAVRDAAGRACEKLGLTVHEVEQRGRHTWVLRLSDRRRAMRLIIEERAPRLTQLQANVGLFGPQSVGELILKHTLAELQQQAAGNRQ